MVRKPLRLLFVVAGFLSLGIGIIGIVLPIIPTTPLLLLASYCFMRGSERFERWFKGSKLYKKHLEEFVRKGGMTLRQKLTILLLADFMIAIPFIMIDRWILRLVLVAAIIYKYYYFFAKIKTVPNN
ncbi:DUF454 domain-containing protein [Neobacillus notoginsengisoli]|uniref:DUF454 domain-containing protein n=1 Tax=Neobacillus notoginsengisoli TaxID=1578198 RepID=A0A417YVN1_9BACI|nr:YbaN family protein [Neobacillus notoginsengisoli]RHW41459.1 DUF454 domain-containing protein [Neobacillus notoginsengisoli]